MKKKKRSLFTKMLITYMCIVLASFITIATILTIWFKDYYIKQIKVQLVDQKDVISNKVYLYRNGFIEYDELQQFIVVTSKYFKGDVWIYDNYGYICCISDNTQEKIVGKRFSDDFRNNFKKNDCIEKKTTFDGIYNNPVYSLQFPIIVGETNFIGSMVINIPFTNISEPLNKFYRITWISALFVMAFSGIAIYIFSQRSIIRPLNDINNVAKKIAKGEVQKRVINKSNDEIGELSDSFNYMADFLEKVDDNRKQFLSNISHEIRSPITSIKGFIGGMLDGVIPKDKYDYYLRLTYEETQRLTRLVNEFLDLSALQDGKFKLIIEELDINEIIRTTILKFENNIKEKELSIDVVFDNDKMLVLGDRDKLAQVVTNLIDNAIKYSIKGTNVVIKVKDKTKKAEISIHNVCDPIPQEDLSEIWQRFYKGDRSRTVKNSTGLGLAIVREILTQLNQEIWIENIDDGVTFYFTLEKNR